MEKILILASASPRRQQLLKQVNIPFTIRIPDIDESEIKTKDPMEKVTELAKRKGQAVPISNSNEVILSADTIVAFEEQILEKPNNRAHAYEMISALSGNIHDVYTGVCIRSENREKVFAERTKVEFWPLKKEEIEAYIATEEPYDKAGAYGIQHYGAIFVKQIIGDYFNVVGLPVSRVVRELKQFGIYPNITGDN